MRESGSDSWRLSEDVPALAHLALYVRDALRLPVPVTAELPPRLDAPVPDTSAALPDAERDAAAEQWLRWWGALLDAEAAAHDRPPTPTSTAAGAGSDAARTARELAHALAQTMRPVTPEPPDFAALAGSPALQRAVAATFADGTRYVDRHRRDLLVHDRPAQLPWVLLSDTAERVAAERAVPIGALHGQVIVLMVQGSWWTLPAPGVALASVHAARDRGLAAEIVTRVFTSALDG